jgi:DeoR/GlpR family transcriptional regulator of sugar metabolism
MTEERDLQALVQQYVVTRHKFGAVSISRAGRALRTVMPRCPLEGRELADAIAARAVAEGYAVHFDGSET